MRDRPIQPTPTPATPVSPTARVAPGTAAGTGPAVAPDRLALAGRPPAIEADVRLAMRGGPAFAAEGTVRVRRGFIERFIKQVLADKRVFPRMEIGFDPATKRYTSEGTVRWHGIPVPVAIAAHPVAVGDRLGVQFEAPKLLLGGWRIEAPFLTSIATGAVLTELGQTRIEARQGDRPGLVLLTPASLIRELGILPPKVSVDLARTKLDVALTDAGDLTLGLQADGVPAAAPASPRSDIALAVDEAALQALMRQALAPDYELGGIALRANGAVVTGKADYKPISDTLTLAKGLLLLAAMSGGQSAQGLDASPVVVKGRLDLDVKVDGRVMTIRPSLGPATDEMAKLLATAGIPAQKVPGGVRVDLDAAAQAVGVTLGQLRIDEHGVSLQAGVDLEQLIRNPALLAGE